jgi:PPOX class probable F420-dependent enzyme
MTGSEAAAFAAEHHHAVLITRRENGDLQSSPIAVVAGDDDHLWVSTRAGSAKERNLTRDPRASLCIVTDQWFGPWKHVDAEATIIRLPEAMPLLEEYYRRAAGEHDDWEDYRRAMTEENRVILDLTVSRVAGP